MIIAVRGTLARLIEASATATGARLSLAGDGLDALRRPDVSPPAVLGVGVAKAQASAA